MDKHDQASPSPWLFSESATRDTPRPQDRAGKAAAESPTAPSSTSSSTFDGVSTHRGMSTPPVSKMGATDQSGPGRRAAPHRLPGPHPALTTVESPSTAPPLQRTRAVPAPPQHRLAAGRPCLLSRGQGGAGRGTPALSHDAARPACVRTVSSMAALDKIVFLMEK